MTQNNTALHESLRPRLYDRRNKEADIRFLLLTYNAPGGKEIWAAMSEAEREEEEAEYRDLIQSMREKGIFLAAERSSTTTRPEPSACATAA